jgi:hypothetical protein
MKEKFRVAKVFACILAVILLVSLWLYLITNMKHLQLFFLIAGAIFTTLLVVYAIVMLCMIAVEIVGVK